MFRAVVPIGTPVAVRAMAQEPEPDFALWEDCGGQKLAEHVLEAASARRQSDLDAARSDLAEHFLPRLEALTEPDATPDLDSDGLASSDMGLPPLNNPILEDWLAAIASIREDLREASQIEPAAFLQSCQEIVEDFAERLDGGSEIDPEGDWIPSEFEKATDLLLLLQFETGRRPCQGRHQHPDPAQRQPRLGRQQRRSGPQPHWHLRVCSHRLIGQMPNRTRRIRFRIVSVSLTNPRNQQGLPSKFHP